MPSDSCQHRRKVVTVSSQNPVETKAAVSVSEMARMVGLSRQRFAQLQGTTFPSPLYDVATRRPFYPEALQEVCLVVRRRNWGIDDRAILFYAPRSSGMPSKTIRETKARPKKNITDLVDGLKSLGLTTATAAQVEQLAKELYPNGTAGIDHGEVLRSLFLAIRRQNSAVNVGSKE
jgi:hypothetical protein